MERKHSLMEAVLYMSGTVVGGIAGGIVAWKLGTEMVDYARTVSENKDMITYMINQHPTLTKLGSAAAGVGILGKAGAIPSRLYELGESLYLLKRS